MYNWKNGEVITAEKLNNMDIEKIELGSGYFMSTIEANTATFVQTTINLDKNLKEIVGDKQIISTFFVLENLNNVYLPQVVSFNGRVSSGKNSAPLEIANDSELDTSYVYVSGIVISPYSQGSSGNPFAKVRVFIVCA